MDKKYYEDLLKDALNAWETHIAISDTNQEEREKESRKWEFKKAFEDLIKNAFPKQ